jgi:nucleobase transporter 1/2
VFYSLHCKNQNVISLQVASRRVTQVGALTMVVFGIFGKFGALFVTIPEPIIGGVFIVMFGE